MEVLQLLKQNPRYVGQYRANTLKPGYTGFIPQRAYRCGSTYGNDAAECMHAFCETNKKVILKNAELRLQITSSPKLKPIVSDQEVTRAIHNYCERREFSLKVSEKEMLEPPKIGWTGYIPKSKVTELGLGDCYHIMTGKCFEAFKTSISGDPQASSRPLNKNDFIVHVSEGPEKRLYRPEGMLPHYTGYIPHQPFTIGKTYGNMCRSASVCFHQDNSYGQYTRKKQALHSKPTSA
ncbi:uncharacterized protein C10orf82 homolog [Acipenser ruthenus]|uniref:uncharacterized protein C10orf82 homolog n=1 Tax=Acipenser ruthenus TaxID=7906 RepID=UPI002740A2F8|nr:uncharacterized protein C10orf82 homolog [Acipenser ruthenus]XP_058891264.1 uncharacterized protein C10orf82 homolog [Acipenser ruthenus]